MALYIDKNGNCINSSFAEYNLFNYKADLALSGGGGVHWCLLKVHSLDLEQPMTINPWAPVAIYDVNGSESLPVQAIMLLRLTLIQG